MHVQMYVSADYYKYFYAHYVHVDNFYYVK